MSKSRFLTENDMIYTTNKERSLVDVGGLKMRSELTDKTTKEILKLILQPYKAPTINEFLINEFKTKEKGNTNLSSITLSFKSEYWSDVIKSYSINIKRNSESSVLLYSKNSNLTFSNYILSQSINSGFSDSGLELLKQTNTDRDDSISTTITVTDGISNITKSLSFSYIRPYYTKVLNSSDTFNFSNIIINGKKTISQVTKNMTVSYDGNDKDIQYSVFAFPKSYGKNVTAIDSNGFSQEWMQIKNSDNDDGYFTVTKTVNGNIINLDYYVFKSAEAKFGKNTTYKITVS